ncbi:MAG TPA: hypothetical protein VM599_02380 [Thermoanaerobaculia bacterium]|nr:hypothetical protein [Thermoanaerobaculia bacterium]
MFSPRSSRPCRQLALCLVLIAAFLATTLPAQAAPGGEQAPRGPLSGLVAWFHGLVLDLGFAPLARGGEPEGLRPVFLPESGCIDPDGVPISCPKTVTDGAPAPARPAISELRRAPEMR